MLGRRILAAAAFAATVSAQSQSLSIITPNPNSWWVAASENTIAWNCNNLPSSTMSLYLTLVLTNSNTSILDAPFALIASIPVYDCSYTVNQQQSSVAVSDTYTVELANSQNMSDIYASSQFSVKPAGSAYPATSSAGASGTATGSAATSSSTSSNSKSGAVANYIPVGMSMAAAVLLGLVVG